MLIPWSRGGDHSRLLGLQKKTSRTSGSQEKQWKWCLLLSCTTQQCVKTSGIAHEGFSHYSMYLHYIFLLSPVEHHRGQHHTCSLHMSDWLWFIKWSTMISSMRHRDGDVWETLHGSQQMQSNWTMSSNVYNKVQSAHIMCKGMLSGRQFWMNSMS